MKTSNEIIESVLYKLMPREIDTERALRENGMLPGDEE